jgi:predicted ATP-grasp superfamily ATP-dependent carboligase
MPGSIVVAADGRQAVPLGFSRQLVGEARFGAHGFRYCGSLLGSPATRLFAGQSKLLRLAQAAADSIVQEFGLIGLNSIDFIARNGVPYPIEVNPRYSASMELIERAHRLSIFQVHADACRGKLPLRPPSPRSIHGKAIVFARHDVVLGDTRSWLAHEWLADIPHPGESVQKGHPICTVFADAPDEKTCRRLLTRRVGAVYRFALARRRRAA